jgi:hypothetical protein
MVGLFFFAVRKPFALVYSRSLLLLAGLFLSSIQQVSFAVRKSLFLFFLRAGVLLIPGPRRHWHQPPASAAHVVAAIFFEKKSLKKLEKKPPASAAHVVAASVHINSRLVVGLFLH